MNRKNKAIAFDLLDEMIIAHEEMASDRRWLEATASDEGADYYVQLKEDYEDSMGKFLKLRREVFLLMVKGLGE